MADEGLISLSTNLTSPRLAKPSDFGKADNSHMAEGMDKLITLTEYQGSPRCIVDDGKGSGYGTPVSTDSGSKIKSAFPVMTSKGEGAPVSDVSGSWSNDFTSGAYMGSGPEKSKPLPK